MKKKLVIMIDWFLPGYKAGGQIQSCANLADALHNEFDIYVITTDRDLGDNSLYSNIVADQWTILKNNVQVFYVSPLNLRYTYLQKVILAIEPDCLYLNSMFSWYFTAIPLLITRHEHKKIKIILAPRGMLHAGALQYSRLKKKAFLAAFKLAGLHKNIFFQATDETEQKDIHQVFGNRVKVRLVQDFNASAQQPFQTLHKETGVLKCLFVSRIAPKKNLLYLLYLLSVLPLVTARVSLVIVGPVEDESYWNECLRTIEHLPVNITVSYAGAVPHQQLDKYYLDSHLFILPTFGENFGHVIFESLLYGRPVLISDKTPWQDLKAKEAGWSINTGKKELILSALLTACTWNQEAFDTHAKAAWNYASNYIQKAGLKEKYIALFSREVSEPELA